MIESPTPNAPDDEGGPGGPFPSWTALYAAVIGATLLMILLLYWFTTALDYSGR